MPRNRGFELDVRGGLESIGRQLTRNGNGRASRNHPLGQFDRRSECSSHFDWLAVRNHARITCDGSCGRRPRLVGPRGGLDDHVHPQTTAGIGRDRIIGRVVGLRNSDESTSIRRAFPRQLEIRVDRLLNLRIRGIETVSDESLTGDRGWSRDRW